MRTRSQEITRRLARFMRDTTERIDEPQALLDAEAPNAAP
jgi:hypothetical protein